MRLLIIGQLFQPGLLLFNLVEVSYSFQPFLVEAFDN